MKVWNYFCILFYFDLNSDQSLMMSTHVQLLLDSCSRESDPTDQILICEMTINNVNK